MEVDKVVMNSNKLLKYKGKKFTLTPLKSALDVRIFLEKLVHWTLKGEMEMDTATKLTYMSGMLLKSIEQARTEKALDESDRLFKI